VQNGTVDGGGGLSASIDSIASHERASLWKHVNACWQDIETISAEETAWSPSKGCQPIDRARPWQGHVKSKANRADDDDAGSTL